MNTEVPTSADDMISYLKDTIDRLWDTCSSDTLQQTMTYAEGVYGIMQHAELKEIMILLNALKEHIDCLTENCPELPDGPHEDNNIRYHETA